MISISQEGFQCNFSLRFPVKIMFINNVNPATPSVIFGNLMHRLQCTLR